jgi:hypothetical protein
MGVNLAGLINQSEQRNFFAFYNTGSTRHQDGVDWKILIGCFQTGCFAQRLIHSISIAKNKFVF